MTIRKYIFFLKKNHKYDSFKLKKVVKVTARYIECILLVRGPCNFEFMLQKALKMEVNDLHV